MQEMQGLEKYKTKILSHNTGSLLKICQSWL